MLAVASEVSAPESAPAERDVQLPPDGQVHVGAVRAHLAELDAAGIPASHAGALAGLTSAQLRKVLTASRYVDRDLALRLMRVHLDPSAAPDRAVISAHGAKRRLQALVALGWRLGEIAQWMGCHQSVLSVILHPDTVAVTARQHRQVAEMYRRWCMTVPAVKNTNSVARARREGWAPPLAWDDIDLDRRSRGAAGTRDRFVDEVAVELALSGVKVRLRRADKLEVVRTAHARRWSDGRIETVTGIQVKTVVRIRQDLGLPGWEMWEQDS